QVVQLDFLGVDIFNSGVDGPYTVDLTLWDEHARSLDVDVHTTAQYFAIDFEPSPPARWVPPFADSGRDLQGDGLWDDLVVNTSVLADRHGTHSWTMELWDATMTMFIGASSGQFDLASGTNPASLTFPGLQIWNSGIDGPYGVNLLLYDSEGRQVDLATFTTAAYLARDFQGPAGQLTPPYFDLGVDRNGDTVLDVIAVDVPITVSRASTFILSGILIDGTFAFVGVDQRFVDLQPGLTTVRLNFTAADAFRNSPDGAFFGILQLQTISRGTTLFIDSDQFTTRNYTSAPFDQGPPVRLTGRVTATGTGAPLEDVGVMAWSPATRLQRTVNTDVSGSYELTLPPGDYYVFADGASRNAQGVLATVTSDRTLNFVLDLPAPNVLTGDVSFTNWDTAAFTGDFSFGADAALVRFQFDVIFGNGDGIASQRELDRLFEFGAPPSLPLTTRDTFTVDGRSYLRVNGTERFALSGAGPIISSAPLMGRATASFAAPSAIPPMPVHVGRFLTQFDTVASTQTFSLGWPANFAMTSFDPVTGIAVSGIGAPAAGIDPASDPNPRDFVQEEWVNLTVETTDTTPPLVTGAALNAASNLRSRPGPTVTVTATASDAGRGDWPIQGANFTRGLRNWASSVAMSATDGSFDSVTESLTGSLATAALADGPYSICVYARDIVPNNDTTGSCASLTIDGTPPTTATVRVGGATTKTVVVGTPVTLTATVSDASAGNGVIAGANYTRGAAAWASSRAMSAADGTFDSPTESVTATVDTTGWTAGTYDLCVYGRDDLGNGDPAATDCAQLIVLDQDVTDPTITGARALPNPANVSETVNLSAFVTDNVGVDTVYIEIFDGTGRSLENRTATYDAASGRYITGRPFTVPGTYTYRVSARDASGNWATSTGTFSIRAPPSGGSPLGGLWWVVVLVVAVAAAIFVYISWTRRRRPAASRPVTSTPSSTTWPPTGPATGTPPQGSQQAMTEMDEIDKPLPPPPP
ncbi:MAG TPA: carboxypeptidase regulatory-like domain-containing protein, partial [Thermoplasmata archaeon]|nr:carboxypeptidase regulatory-like domain-containing protein [Thermoplasmata archaeon]